MCPVPCPSASSYVHVRTVAAEKEPNRAVTQITKYLHWDIMAESSGLKDTMLQRIVNYIPGTRTYTKYEYGLDCKSSTEHDTRLDQNKEYSKDICRDMF